jgi:fluoride exporter
MDKSIPLVFGALLGVFARYLVATRIYMMTGTGFPFGTLAVNISGCLLVGVFDSWAGDRGLIGPAGRLFLMTGFCATYTTFSTLILESAHLISNGQIARALAYYLGSGVLGFVSFRLGAFLGRIF